MGLRWSESENDWCSVPVCSVLYIVDKDKDDKGPKAGTQLSADAVESGVLISSVISSL